MSGKQVIILSGISGSGKSTLAHSAAVKLGSVLIVSADQYFSHGDKYVFDPTKIAEAHKYCFRRFLTALGWWSEDCQLTSEYDVVFVDNTNLSAAEIAPYVMAAEASGYEAKIVRVNADPDEAHNRNVHDIPLEVANRQFTEFAKRDVMPWWNVVDIESGEEIPL